MPPIVLFGLVGLSAGLWSAVFCVIDRAYCRGTPFEPAFGRMSAAAVGLAVATAFSAGLSLSHWALFGG